MKKIFKLHLWLYVFIILIALVAAAGGGYYFMQYQKTQQLLKNPTLAAQVEVQQVLGAASQLMDLPKDEQPTVATVSDVKKLKDQPFFAKARNGDKVLIYTKAKEAILYDPAANKIVEVAPVNIGAPSGAPTPTPQIIKVAIYNGTAVTGLSTTTEKDLKDKINNIDVVSKGNAGSQYVTTLVVDLTGGHQTTAASQLAALLHGTTGNLPAGELKPVNADILIILGSSK